MPSKIQVDQIAGATGSTVTLPSGQTLDLSSGTVNLPSASLSALNATNLTSGTVPSARLSLTSSDLPTVPTTKGGTGLTTIGTANQVLRVNSGATALEFGTVTSLFTQIIQTVKTDTDSIASNAPTFVDISSFSATITPTSASNKVLVIVHLNTSSSNGYRTFHRLERGGTAIGVGTSVGSRTAATMITEGAGNQGFIASMMFLDSPATTSATTYNVASCTESAGGTVVINTQLADNNDASFGRGISTITLIEVKV